MPSRPRPSRYGLVLVALVVLQAFASFLNGNRSQILHPERVLAYALATTLLALVVLALATRWWGGTDRDRVAVSVAVVWAAFLGYSSLFDPDPPRAAHLVVWAVLTALVARLAYLVGGNQSLRFGLVVFAALLLAIPMISYATYAVTDDGLQPVADPGPLPTPAVRPNVYWLMLDGYARPDQLERVVGYDDAAFVTALEERGFQVSTSSRASYPRTHLSLSSTLDMRYVLEPGHDVTDDFGTFGPVVIGNNDTVARFHALGYQYAYGTAGGVEWSACRDDLVDVCLPINRPSPATGELEKALLGRTPLGGVSLPVPYADPVTFAAAIADPGVGLQEPFFAFQHVLGPHRPYRYREDCTARDRPFVPDGLPITEQMGFYRTQVRCLNDLTLRALDSIIERDPTAIVLLQSDHGSSFSFTWPGDMRAWTPTSIQERFSAFDAMRLPPACHADVEGEPLVNTFPIVFGCIEGTKPHLLPYRAFVVPLDDVQELTELTPEQLRG